MLGIANIMSVSERMPTSLLLLVTGRCFILLCFIRLAASWIVACWSIVVTGVVATILAVMALGGSPCSYPRTRASLVVMMPTGLSFCTRMIEFMSYLVSVAITSCRLVSWRTTLGFLVMMSLTIMLVAIQNFSKKSPV